MSLTRGQAIGLVMDSELEELRALCTFWIGHGNEDCDLEELQTLMCEYVDAACVDGDHVRSYGPHDSDLTDLEAP